MSNEPRGPREWARTKHWIEKRVLELHQKHEDEWNEFIDEVANTWDLDDTRAYQLIERAKDAVLPLPD